METITLRDFLQNCKSRNIDEKEMKNFIKLYTNNFDKTDFENLRNDLNKYANNIKFTIINEIIDESGAVEQFDRPTTVYNYIEKQHEYLSMVLTPRQKIDFVLNDLDEKGLNYEIFKDDYFGFLRFSDMVETEFNKLNIDTDTPPPGLIKTPLICDKKDLQKLHADFDGEIWESVELETFLDYMRVEPIGQIKRIGTNEKLAIWLHENIEDNRDKNLIPNMGNWFKKLIGKNINYSTFFQE